MVDTHKIIEDLKEQEKKGIFKGLRKRKQMVDKFQPTLKTTYFNQPFHIQNALKLTGEFKVLDKFERYIISGVGVNAQGGELLREYLSDYNYDIEVNREFALPKDVNNKTLVFIVSFNGNDEEAISCYKNALRKGCKIIGLTSGGRLGEGFKKNNTEHVILPAKIIESTSMVYTFFSILKIFENSQLIKPQKEYIEEVQKSIKKPEIKEMAKALYEKILDKIPVVYSSRELSAVTNYWKLQLNLNSKIPCMTNVFSDAAHSELNAFFKNQWDFYIIFLVDQEDSEFVKSSMKTAKKIIRNREHGTTEIMVKGGDRLTRIITSAHIAELTSYFLREYYGEEEDLVGKYQKEYNKKS